jgi:hypothetical protein
LLTVPTGVVVALPVAVFSAVKLATVHVYSTDPLVVRTTSELPVDTLATTVSTCQPVPQAVPAGGVVVQRTVAEALLAAMNAVRAIAATAARPSIFKYLMVLSLCSGA